MGEVNWLIDLLAAIAIGTQTEYIIRDALLFRSKVLGVISSFGLSCFTIYLFFEYLSDCSISLTFNFQFSCCFWGAQSDTESIEFDSIENETYSQLSGMTGESEESYVWKDSPYLMRISEVDAETESSESDLHYPTSKR